MKSYFGMQTRPSSYAWDVVNRTGVKGPPVPLMTVAETLRLRVEYFQGSQHFKPDREHEEDQPASPDACDELVLSHPDRASIASTNGARQPKPFRGLDGLLKRETRLIWLDSERAPTRQRMSFGHECGHFVLPAHQGLSYVENGFSSLRLASSSPSRRLRLLARTC